MSPSLLATPGQIIGYRSKKNPWVAVREHAHRLLLSFCSEFGISPAARTRKNVRATDSSEADIEALLSGPRLTDEEKQKMQQ
jgi:phage terminase small subunit